LVENIPSGNPGASADWQRRSGIDVMIFKILSPKNSAKKLAFLTQNKAKLCKNWIITLVFEKNAKFFAENCQKSPKIVIIKNQTQKATFFVQIFLPFSFRAGPLRFFPQV
jgi:hypothetical protein